MAKSIKLKDNTYWSDNSIIYENQELGYWLNNRVYRDQISIGYISQFNQAYGYKEIPMTCPAKTMLVVTGLHSGAVSGSMGLQITNIYNGIYVNNTSTAISYSYWLNYVLRGNAPTDNKAVYLDVLCIKL